MCPPLSGLPITGKVCQKESLHSHWKMQSNICLKKERFQMFGTGRYSFELQPNNATWERGSCFQRQLLLNQAKSILCRQCRGSITSRPDCRYSPSGLQAMGLAEVEDYLLPAGFVHCLPFVLCYLSSSCTPVKMAITQNTVALLLKFY